MKSLLLHPVAARCREARERFLTRASRGGEEGSGTRGRATIFPSLSRLCRTACRKIRICIRRRDPVNKSGQLAGGGYRKEDGAVARHARGKKSGWNLSPLRCHFVGAISARRIPFDNPRYAIATLVASVRTSRDFTADMNMQYFSTPRRSCALYCARARVRARIRVCVCVYIYIYIYIYIYF